MESIIWDFIKCNNKFDETYKSCVHKNDDKLCNELLIKFAEYDINKFISSVRANIFNNKEKFTEIVRLVLINSTVDN